MDENLQKLLDRLVPALNPIEVYLFGSRARGDARPDSDYDLFFVVQDDTRIAQMSIQDVTSLYGDIGIDADIVPCRYSTFSERKDMIGSLSSVVKREGVQVYARAQ